MIARLILTALYALWLSCSTVAAQTPLTSEQIESDISSRYIAIESNFTGEKIVIFGTIENSRQSEFEPGLYDVVVVIRGPKETIVARQKSQVAGIWINRDSQTFANAPGYYALLSGRELKDITNKMTLNAYGLGFDNLGFRPLGAQIPSRVTGALAEFRNAVVRIKQREGLYIYNPEGVVFVGRNLFRATVDLPANVPVGQYATDVYLLREGDVLSHNRSQLTINKQGFEQFVYSAAFDHPLIYGIIAVIIAVSAGLLASAMARRD
jgi:uncharacterized protein (TIGR02186 family)